MIKRKKEKHVEVQRDYEIPDKIIAEMSRKLSGEQVGLRMYAAGSTAMLGTMVMRVKELAEAGVIHQRVAGLILDEAIELIKQSVEEGARVGLLDGDEEFLHTGILR